MFCELYHRVSAMIDDLSECREEFCKIPGGKLREQGQELITRIQTIADALHEPEEAHLVKTVPRFAAAFHQVLAVLGRLQASPFSDMIKCGCSTCQVRREKTQPTIPIDRPEMPEPPLEIPGKALVAYLRQLSLWIKEAYEDLSIDDDLELPSIGDRYLVADTGQLVYIAECLKTGGDLRCRWEELIREEGPRWSSVEIGLARISVIMAARKVLADVLSPPEEDACTIGKMIGQAIDENGLPPGPGGFLFGSFGPGSH